MVVLEGGPYGLPGNDGYYPNLPSDGSDGHHGVFNGDDGGPLGHPYGAGSESCSSSEP